MQLILNIFCYPPQALASGCKSSLSWTASLTSTATGFATFPFGSLSMGTAWLSAKNAVAKIRISWKVTKFFSEYFWMWIQVFWHQKKANTKNYFKNNNTKYENYWHFFISTLIIVFNKLLTLQITDLFSFTALIF